MLLVVEPSEVMLYVYIYIYRLYPKGGCDLTLYLVP